MDLKGRKQQNNTENYKTTSFINMMWEKKSRRTTGAHAHPVAHFSQTRKNITGG